MEFYDPMVDMMRALGLWGEGMSDKCETCVERIAERAAKSVVCRHDRLKLGRGYYYCGDCGEERSKHLGLCPECNSEHKP